MYVKTHKKEGEIIVTACDRELLGKTLVEGEIRFEVNKGFYGNSPMDISGLFGILSEATIANLIGNRVVEKAIEEGFVNENCVIRIAGVKHAQVVLMK